MKNSVSGVTAAVLGTVALAFITGQGVGLAQSAAAPAGNPQATAAAGEQMTVMGCIQREADYRKSVSAGRGGVAGTGAGAGNEFVLANAMMAASATSGSAATSGAGAPSATGTAGATSNTAYELTGPNEGQAANFVGKRVQITGKMKAGDAAGGPTGTVPGSQDLKLREFEVSSIRETAGSCTATP